jgi:hypothetical protein
MDFARFSFWAQSIAPFSALGFAEFLGVFSDDELVFVSVRAAKAEFGSFGLLSLFRFL